MKSQLWRIAPKPWEAVTKTKSAAPLAIFPFFPSTAIKLSQPRGWGFGFHEIYKHKEKAIFLATQARDAAPHYQHSEIGYNYRLSNISAGIGRGQMEVLDKHVALRRGMNSFYRELFKKKEGVTVFAEPDDPLFFKPLVIMYLSQ